jgi:hypothetical protein
MSKSKRGRATPAPPTTSRNAAVFVILALFRVRTKSNTMSIDTITRRRGFDRIIAKLRNFPRFTFSRTALVVGCLFLVGIVGYIDYLTGYERSLLLFYLLPISLAAWFGSSGLGFAIVIVSIVIWMLSDIAARIPAVGFWNVGMAFGSFALFAIVLLKLRALVRELDQRVHERTAAYNARLLSGSGSTKRSREWQTGNGVAWSRPA